MSQDLVQFTITVVGPIVVLLAVGKLLYASGRLSEGFIASGTQLVFNIALPALLFISISQANFSAAANIPMITVGLSGTLGFFLACLIVVSLLFKNRHDRGVIIQGSFRANLGVIGLAFAAKTFNQADFAQAAVFMGALILLYNVLSIWVLNHYLPNKKSLLSTFNEMLTNPIIIAIVAALLFAYLDWSLPALVQTSTEYFAQLTLPLALLCTGAAIRFRDMKGQQVALLFTVVCKCLLYPLILVSLGLMLDFNEIELLTVLFMTIAPAAAVSFIMVKAMGGNADLAANIVAITTVVSIPITLVGYVSLMWVIG